jgi:uncharacterized membrane protein YphA (DoxX/SURF4 family)
MKYLENLDCARADIVAFILRIGLGLVFIIGGYSKLSQLLSASGRANMLTAYTAGDGYINQFFIDYLFGGRFGDGLTPWSFLTALSTFELATGLMLIVGIAVRPLALVWGLLLWTFVMALPVTTTPGVDVAVKTFTAPAMLIQARDIALSGLFFALYSVGSGFASVDTRWLGRPLSRRTYDSDRWQAVALLIRLSVALPLLVGGAFHGTEHLPTFGLPAAMLFGSGLLLALGVATRPVAVAVVLSLVWFMLGKIDPSKSGIAILNSFKRELALVAGAGVLAWAGGGFLFAPTQQRRSSGG